MLNKISSRLFFNFKHFPRFKPFNALHARFFSQQKKTPHVTLSPQVVKVVQEPRRVPEKALDSFYSLFREIGTQGPYRSHWPNYSKLKDNVYHCHLSGAFDWVAVWKVSTSQDVEFLYFGTRQTQKNIKKSSINPLCWTKTFLQGRARHGRLDPIKNWSAR